MEELLERSDFRGHKTTKTYTAVYNRARKKRRQKTTSIGSTERNDSLVGKQEIKNSKLNMNNINTVVRDTLNEIGGAMNSRKNVLVKKNRIFLSECINEEDLRALQTVRVWKSRRTGKPGFDKFRRTVDFITFTLKIFNCKNSSKLTEHETILFFIDTHTQEKQDNLLFDVAPFKSISQKSFVNSVKDILEKSSLHRTEADITLLLNILRNFSKFSSYPLHVQKELCAKAWYSRFDNSHVIAREGQRADFYYFILSGVVVSRCLGNTIKPEERRRQLAEFHREGDIIGEREILTNTERNGTYVSKESTEVLGMDRDILLDIFKSSGGLECVNFLRSIPDLQDFPLQLLQTNHFFCSSHYFKRGAVIVKNSYDSEWVYAVRSGSCQAFKMVTFHENSQNITLQMKKTTFLPSLDNKGSLKSKSSDHHRALKNVRNRCQRTHLPSINKVENSIVSQNYYDSSCCMNECSEKSTTKERKTNNTLQTYYVKLEHLTERQCFGLHSLVFDEISNIILVSNGAECILISKRFLKDNINKDIRQKLKAKITPYPNWSQIQKAVTGELSWQSYKGRVLHETMK